MAAAPAVAPGLPSLAMAEHELAELQTRAHALAVARAELDALPAGRATYVRSGEAAILFRTPRATTVAAVDGPQRAAPRPGTPVGPRTCLNHARLRARVSALAPRRPRARRARADGRAPGGGGAHAA